MSEVTFSPEPDPNPTYRSIRPLPGAELAPVPSPSQQRRMSASSIPHAPQPGYASSPSAAYPGLPQVEETGFSIQQFIAQEPPPRSPVLTNPSVNEFGTYSTPPMSNQPSTISVVDRNIPGPRGGRFATFPVKAAGPRPQPSTNPYVNAPPMSDGDRVPSIEIDRNNEESFSSSIASALGQYSLDGPSGSSGPSSGARPPHGPPSRDVKGGDFGPQRYSPPPPMYTPSEGQGLPVGAAPSTPPSGMGFDAHSIHGNGNGNGNGKGALRPLSTHHDDEGLAYMSPGRGDASAESLADDGDRRVRFGGVTDVDTELERRHHEQELHQAPQPPQTQGQGSQERQVPGSGPRSARVPVPPLDEGLNRHRNGWTLHDGEPSCRKSTIVAF